MSDTPAPNFWPDAIGQRSRQQRMPPRVEGRLCGEPENVVVERTGIQALAGHLGEAGHPVADELLTTCVEIRVRPADALRFALTRSATS